MTGAPRPDQNTEAVASSNFTDFVRRKAVKGESDRQSNNRINVG